MTLPFLVPARQRYFPVQVAHRPAALAGIDAQSIEVSLDTWYGGIAPRLALVYASADQRCWSSVAPATCAINAVPIHR